MINMSHCRFNNTNLALNECLDAIQTGKELSISEMNSCKQMFKTFINFCSYCGIVEDDDDGLDDRLEEFFETIGDKSYWN